MALKVFPLRQANLHSLPPEVGVPTYNRKEVGQSICHVGVGGFHRAHQAVYADDLLQKGKNLEWGLCGIGLLPHDSRIRDVLQDQDYLYTVVERELGHDQARIIGSIVNFLYAPENRETVLQKLASPETKIVSMTITEGGYYLNQATGEFDDQHPDIKHDLEHPEEPNCSFGYLIEALNRRRQRGQPPFTIMSCDNVQSNGHVSQKMLMAFAELRDPTIRNWLERNGAFPNSMVDRITPATTDAHREFVREKFGIDDAWPVVPEGFRQWVIEDHFLHGRPAWEEAGAEMTSDVLPYEKMKMRLLNASHQTMCYIGMLVGYEYADEAMGDAEIVRFVQRMMDEEVTPILDPVPGIDLEDYKRTLIRRFSNPAIKDTLIRLATEGSARIPKFVLPSIVESLSSGTPNRLLIFTVATWFRYLTGIDDRGRELPIIDPLKDRLQERARQGKEDPGPLLEMAELFPAALTQSRVFLNDLSEAMRYLYGEGARAALTRYVGA
ncbi:MAG: mannitol dehydrogenase family protein [Verrucomicrobia bacterium]|nr:mannitol dehydrogenase family protein [Verrucomicrobiota bacterium]